MNLKYRLLTYSCFVLSFLLWSTARAVRSEAIVTGTVTRHRVERLTGEINWYRSLKEAEAAAQHNGKMVFWVHMLGRMDGGT